MAVPELGRAQRLAPDDGVTEAMNAALERTASAGPASEAKPVDVPRHGGTSGKAAAYGHALIVARAIMRLHTTTGPPDMVPQPAHRRRPPPEPRVTVNPALASARREPPAHTTPGS